MQDKLTKLLIKKTELETELYKLYQEKAVLVAKKELLNIIKRGVVQ